MEAEIRRLEELNRVEAQRMQEPFTNNGSPQLSPEQERRLQEVETKENCPDEYNLLESTTSGPVDSIEILKLTSPDI